MEELFVFIRALEARQHSPASAYGALPQTPEFIESGRMAPGKASLFPERGSLPGRLSHHRDYSGCSPAEPYPFRR